MTLRAIAYRGKTISFECMKESCMDCEEIEDCLVAVHIANNAKDLTRVKVMRGERTTFDMNFS